MELPPHVVTDHHGAAGTPQRALLVPSPSGGLFVPPQVAPIVHASAVPAMTTSLIQEPGSSWLPAATLALPLLAPSIPLPCVADARSMLAASQGALAMLPAGAPPSAAMLLAPVPPPPAPGAFSSTGAPVLLPSLAAAAAMLPGSQGAQPQQAAQGDGPVSVFFAGVTPVAEAPQLLALFSQFGTVHDINLFRPFSGSKTSKGCGLVVFASRAEAAAAMDTLHGKFVWPGACSAMVIEWQDPDKQHKKRRAQPLRRLTAQHRDGMQQQQEAPRNEEASLDPCWLDLLA